VYGKHGGFTNSFYEKYIFFAPGLRNPGFSGELLFMNAKPYPGPHGKMQRQIVSQGGPQFYMITRDEDYVQKMFQQMGIREPKADPMPTPPPAASRFRQTGVGCR
jgi:hypothetical protein